MVSATPMAVASHAAVSQAAKVDANVDVEVVDVERDAVT